MVCGLLGLAAIGGWALLPAPTPAAPAREAAAAPTLACAFDAGERRAYDVTSRVGVADTEDRFDGVLSLEAVEVSGAALLRAAFSEVRLAQSLSEPADRVGADELEGAPFFVRVDARCRLTEIGFPEAWSPAARHLATSVLRANEIVLPGAATDAWQAAQVDGGGDYVARYSARSDADAVRVVRLKVAYEADPEAARLGATLEVLSARADALYDPSARAIVDVRGEERLRLSMPSGERHTIAHRFSMARRDAAYRPVARADVNAARFDDARSVEAREAPVDPAIAALSRDEALGRFHGVFDAMGRDGVLPAARMLADWLRAHPEGAAELLTALRDGDIAEHAQATLFLALQRAGTEATRAALVEALDDDRLFEVNRARAAAALAEHGAPSQAVADALLARARDDGSPMVANVSRLGLGTLAGRADGALGESLRDTLSAELEGAGARAEVVQAIDAMGNCADDRFAAPLAARLDAAEPSVRAHAAEALGRLSPDAARARLADHLADEADPAVAASILRGLRQLDDGASLGEADLTLAATQLASPHLEVRAAAVEWLGRSASAQPEVRRLLAAHFHAEADLRLKQRLGAFVSAADLRAAG